MYSIFKEFGVTEAVAYYNLNLEKKTVFDAFIRKWAEQIKEEQERAKEGR